MRRQADRAATAAMPGRDDDRHVRVGDYLDDQLQTLDDLRNLHVLLSNVGSQHDLLRKQVRLSVAGPAPSLTSCKLEEAERDLEEARRASREHVASVRKAAQRFDQEQGDIDRRLMVITRSETSDDAVQRFESSMDRLLRLDVASGYMQLLKQVDDLRWAAGLQTILLASRV